MRKDPTTGILKNPGEGWDELAKGVAEVGKGISEKDTVKIIRGAARIVMGILA